MTKYIYDSNTGKHYQVTGKKKDNNNGAGGGIFWGIVILFLIAIAPGMVIASLVAANIESTGGAWGLSITFSVVILVLLRLLYSKYLKCERYWVWTLVTYAILSGLSIWLLSASEAENIVKLCKLMFPS
jgi:hypothetical protein